MGRWTVVALAVGAAWSASPAQAAVFHVRAGASGNGTAQAPFGSLTDVETAAGPGDTIVVDAADKPLDGGIALKPGQRLEGGPRSASSLPLLTNTQAARLDGDAVRLADGATVSGLVIRGAVRGGIYGLDSVGVTIKGNDVS